MGIAETYTVVRVPKENIFSITNYDSSDHDNNDYYGIKVYRAKYNYDGEYIFAKKDHEIEREDDKEIDFLFKDNQPIRITYNHRGYESDCDFISPNELIDYLTHPEQQPSYNFGRIIMTNREWKSPLTDTEREYIASIISSIFRYTKSADYSDQIRICLSGAENSFKIEYYDPNLANGSAYGRLVTIILPTLVNYNENIAFNNIILNRWYKLEELGIDSSILWTE